MEDFLKFLLIAGVILVGIFKEVSKNNKSKKAQNKRPVPPAPSPVEVDPDAIPIPEFWERQQDYGRTAPAHTHRTTGSQADADIKEDADTGAKEKAKRRSICSCLHSKQFRTR